MLILGLQKMTLLDFPGKIACTTAFPKIGEGGLELLATPVDEDEDLIKALYLREKGGIAC